MIGQISWSAISAALGTQQSTDTETYASGPEMIDRTGDSVWGENVHFQSGPIALLPPDVPLRARKVSLDSGYEIVTVVGSRAFPATRDSRTTELALLKKSLWLAQTFKLHFATVTWAIDAGGATAVRMNAVPGEGELQYTWDTTLGALCEDLTR